MDARELNAFREQQGPVLRGARVQRVVCAVNGLVLELQTDETRCELGLLALRETARVYCFEGMMRDAVHHSMRAWEPSLAASIPQPPAKWPQDASALDALRAWLLRPAAQPPEWLQLEGAILRRVRSEADDRRLWLEFERRDALDRSDAFCLLAELFDRGANFILRSGSDAEVANWKGRRPAPDRNAGAAQAKSEPQATGMHRAREDAAGEPAWALATTLQRVARSCAHELAATDARAQRRHEKRLRAKLKKVEADAERAEQAQTFRRMGETLTANLQRVRRGDARVTLDDLYEPGKALEIELDPRLSPQENAAAYFKRARRGERGRETVAARLQEARRELESFARSPQPQQATHDWPTVLRNTGRRWETALSEALATASFAMLWAPGGPRWERPPETENSGAHPPRDKHPGRLFRLIGDWEVRVGRSNTENDELTHRFAHPDDVWLHASGVPGSHVVLRMQGRRDNPPRDVLEQAAAIAARFSRAKHARTVPVVWTRKRYVRKPRKSAPGVAVCTHEKTLFVEPGLPAGENDVEA